MLTQKKEIIRRALNEDIGDGDVTSLSILPADVLSNGKFIAKQDGVIAGLEVAQLTFSLLNDQVQFTPQVAEAAHVEKGMLIATIHGPSQAILTGERVALNFLQRMSGIATLTNRFVVAVKDSSAVILDTRKTVPGLRIMDKEAVKLGGGENHRFGLFDMVLIKENHITAGGGITAAVAKVRAGEAQQLPIEVEVKNLIELEEALKLDLDRIMLDNMSLEEMREAVGLTDGRVALEASGNATLENVAAIAATGVDFISVGIITHSVQALDISLLFDPIIPGD